MEKIPRLKADDFNKIIALPLDKCDFTPDLIIIENTPEKIMWITLASLKFEDGRHSFSTGIFQACCVDVTVIPYLSQNINASLGCDGCRDATDLEDNKCLVGILYQKLESTISSIEYLSAKAMITVRNKKVLKLYRDNL